MTTAIDTKVATKLAAALARAGTDVTIEQPINHRTVPGVVGQLNDGTQQMTVKGTPPAGVRGFLIDATQHVDHDMEVTIAAAGVAFVPEKETATLTHNGVTYAIADVVPIYSGDDVAAYTLRLRQ